MIIDNIKVKDRWVSMACLDYDEARVLKKLLPKELSKSEKRWKHYSDVQESGEASSLQQTMLAISEEYHEMLTYLSKTLDEYIDIQTDRMDKGEIL